MRGGTFVLGAVEARKTKLKSNQLHLVCILVENIFTMNLVDLRLFCCSILPYLKTTKGIGCMVLVLSIRTEKHIKQSISFHMAIQLKFDFTLALITFVFRCICATQVELDSFHT